VNIGVTVNVRRRSHRRRSAGIPRLPLRSSIVAPVGNRVEKSDRYRNEQGRQRQQKDRNTRSVIRHVSVAFLRRGGTGMDQGY
jgi:hypothetical protein